MPFDSGWQAEIKINVQELTKVVAGKLKVVCTTCSHLIVLVKKDSIK